MLFSATLKIRQGRIVDTNDQADVRVFPVVGIATVELGGNEASRPTYFFECITQDRSMSNNGSGITWTRMHSIMGTTHPVRFEVVNIPDGSPGKRLDLGGIGYTDLGVYVCSDSASNDAVSVNITGCKLCQK